MVHSAEPPLWELEFMATAQRVFWETVAVLAFLVTLVGAYLWSGYRADSARSSLSSRHREEMETIAEQHRTALEELRTEHRRQVDLEAEAAARAAFTSFAAGAHSAIAARWTNYLATAVERFLESPAVLYVHLISPSGRVIASSDAEIRAAGVLGEPDAWALEAETLTTRRADSPGVLELAGPVVSDGRTVAVLWIGYRLPEAAAAASDKP